MRKSLTGLVAVGMALALAACGQDTGSQNASSVMANHGATIGIALPTRVEQRWIADGKNIVEQFTAMGYKPDLQYAGADAARQVKQVQAMIDQGHKLLLVGAVDGSALTGVLAKAEERGIPVIAYDRLIRDTADVDYYATFDNLRVGVMQGDFLVDALGLDEGRKGPFTIELFAGSPDDNNASVFYQGAMKVLRPYLDSGRLVVRSGETAFDRVATPGWDPAAAHARIARTVNTTYRTDTLDAVLAPNDGIARGIILGLREAGYGSADKPLPHVTGQDAELESLKSIMAGEQGLTIFKDTRELAKVAVQMGNALLTGATPKVNDTSQYDNGVKVVPTYLLEPIAVDRSNLRTLLVDGGYYSADELK